MPHPRVLAIALCLALLAMPLALSGCNAYRKVASRFATRDIKAVETHIVGTSLDVRTVNGAIRVSRSTSGAVEIAARVRAADSKRADQVRIGHTRDASGALRVFPIWPDATPLTNEGLDFTILIPDATGVTLTTSNGAISCKNMGGELVASTSNAAVTIATHRGPVQATTSNGAIECDAIEGSASLRSSNARIIARGITGPLDATTSNARIEADLARDNAGPVRLSTSNAGIYLGVGPAFAGQVRATTAVGQIVLDSLSNTRVQGSQSDMTITFSNANTRSTLSTTSGDITLRGSKN